jgi:P2 family phage major capsid protein
MGQHLSANAMQKMKTLHEMTAKAYGGQAGQQFAATPAVAQTLHEKIVVDGGWFYSMINVVPVKELAGEKIGLGTSGSAIGRTDTSGAGERAAKNLASTDAAGYTLKQTNFDIALRYSTIDAWAKFSDFVEKYNKAVRTTIANDRIKVGWRGTSALDTTVAADLSDVNIGWLQQIRDYNGGSQHLLGAAGSVTLGSAAIPNLDTLVHDALQTVAEEFRDDPDLVVIVGANVMQYAKGAYYEAHGNTPTEKAKTREGAIVDTYGGLPAYRAPFFPADAILITSFENLSIYWQEDSWRREQLNNPKKDQYEDFNSDNEGYVVEEFGKTSFVEGIEYQA